MIGRKMFSKQQLKSIKPGLIEHASQRQAIYLSVSKSLNLFFPPDVNKGDLHNIHMLAWAKNLKTLYYLRSEAISVVLIM